MPYFALIIMFYHVKIACYQLQMCMVITYTRFRVKTKSKLTYLKINSQIEGYNGK